MSRPGEPAAGLRPGAAIDEERFAEDMSLMLRSGLSLMDSLKTLRERAGTGTAQPLDRMITRLRQGESVSQAMNGSGAFRPALLACVRASERVPSRSFAWPPSAIAGSSTRVSSQKSPGSTGLSSFPRMPAERRGARTMSVSSPVRRAKASRWRARLPVMVSGS